ncbi:MAG: ASCH domain-containing protein [Acholeplasma sp.]|jgi:uncharacterized protein YhfF|nr:MAG: ASCH domain-containing protein [Acholeplasma sp.]
MSQIEMFWNHFIKTKHLPAGTRYIEIYHFELTEYWANELLRLVLIGKKKATASSLDSFRLRNEPIPKIGDYNIVTDFSGNPKCVVKTTHVMIKPFKDLTFDIVKREGEDDSLESWQIGHAKFFKTEGLELGYTFTENMLVVFEDFEVVYQI